MKLFWVFIFIMLYSSPGAENTWTRWPAKAEEVFGSTIKFPPGFKPIAPLISKVDEELINGRFLSADGLAEFAVTVINCRSMKSTVDARLIKLPLRPNEKIVSRKDARKTVNDTQAGSYELYDEHMTVADAGGNLRYFHLTLSTSRLPGAASVLWELKVNKGGSLAGIKKLYEQFKSSLEVGEH